MHGHVHRRGIERQSRSCLARFLHPVNVFVRRLRQEQQHAVPQLADPPVELRQFLPDVGVVRAVAGLHERLAHPLERQRQRVLHQACISHAQLLPCAVFVPAEPVGLGLLLIQFVARHLEFAEELLHRRGGVLDHPCRLRLKQQAQQPLAGFRVPQPLKVEPHLAARDAHTHVFRGNRTDVVRLVEDHEVVLEQHPLLLPGRVILAAVVAEQAEKQRVVQHQHVSGKNPAAGALVKTGLAQLGDVGAVAAQLGRAEAALRVDKIPHLRIGRDVEVRQAAVGGLPGPLGDSLQFLHLGGGQQRRRLLPGALQPPGAEIVAAPLEHCERKLHRQHLLEHRQILLGQLLLQVDRVGRDHRLFVLANRMQDGRNQIGQAFADACAGLDDEVLAILQRLGHGDGHFLLLGAEFEILRPRQLATLGKKRAGLGDQIQPGALFLINEPDHPVASRFSTTVSSFLFLTRRLAGSTPVKVTFGYSRQSRPMIAPGLSTALQPISVRSPINAPNLAKPLSSLPEAVRTLTLPRISR